MAYRPRDCVVCGNQFTPPHRSTFLSEGDNHLTMCPSCRRLVKGRDEPAPPSTPQVHAGAAPLTQIVFDLETWGLDRGWGVTLVGSFLIHGGASGPVRKTLMARDYPAWKRGERSNDRGLVTDILEILSKGHVAYAHNGDYFDIKWLRTAALKYGLSMPKIKLIDPAAVSRQKYLLGRNSLEAMADYLGLKQNQGVEKMHLSPDVWRHALLDDDDQAWHDLVLRCESDVELLNAVAGAVTGDVGMIDNRGSWK